MNCPLCRDQILEPHHRAGIEIDVCPQCRGVWLDRGELDRLVQGAAPSPFMERPDLEERKPFDASRSESRSEPSGRWDDDDDDDDDHDDERDYRKSKKSKSKPKSKSKSKKRPPKKKSWGELLGDVLEEVLD